ncbi:MAG TPA: toll/interleukin-1 receptor domain-containing protein [Opitutaceae bacterium]|nr:toll/interleukin-1 receptor domain-containing protein [Opitutaceae bacterium]
MNAPPPGNILDPLAVEGPRSPMQRILDWLFGRDFFISYRWEDGRVYAAELARQLKAERFDCFLDSEGYIKGDNWRRIGERELRKTTRLVLVGSPKVHFSEPVAHELKIFRSSGQRVFTIEFGDSLSAEKHPESLILPFLDREAIRQVEDPARLAQGPSPAVVQELRRTFDRAATVTRRLRAIQSACAVLFLLTIAAALAAGVAYSQYRANLRHSAQADAQRAATDAEHGDYDSAVGFFSRSLTQDASDDQTAGALFRLAIEHPPVGLQTVARGAFEDLQLSEDGAVLLLRSHDGELWLSRHGANATTIPSDHHPITQIALSPDGKKAFVAAGPELAAFDPATGKIGEWRTLPAAATALQLANSGDLAVGDESGRVAVIRGSERLQIGKKTDQPIAQVRLLDPPLWVAASDEHAHPWVWDTLRRLAYGDDGEGLADHVLFGSSGIIGFATSDGGGPAGNGLQSSLTVWRYRNEPPASPDANPNDAWEIVYNSPNHELVLISEFALFRDPATYVARLSSGDVEIGLPEGSPRTLSQPGASAFVVAPDLSWLITAHRDGALRRWNGRTGSPTGAAVFAPSSVSRLAASSDGTLVVAVADDEVIAYRFPSSGVPAAITRSDDVDPEPPATFRPVDGRDDHEAARANHGRLKEKAGDPDAGEWTVIGAANPTPFRQPLTEAERSSADSLLENRSIFVNTRAALSDNGAILATSAADQPVRIWEVGGDHAKPRCELTSPFEPGYPDLMVMASDGSRAFVKYSRVTGAVFETRRGTVLSKISLRSYERLWDVSPDLQSTLVSSRGSLQVRNMTTGEMLAGPVTVTAEIRSAGFLSSGGYFYAATRDGQFRIWRTVDGMELAGPVVFDPVAAPNPGAPQDDVYQFTVWSENAAPDSPILRRLAIRVDNDNSDRHHAPALRLFDVGAAGSRRDHLKFTVLLTRLYGVQLSAIGNLTHVQPATVADLAEFRSPQAWDSDDFRAAAEWLLAGRFAGQVSPYSSSRSPREN